MLLLGAAILLGLTSQAGVTGILIGALLMLVIGHGALWARVYFNNIEVSHYMQRLEEQIEEGNMKDTLTVFSEHLEFTWKSVFCHCSTGYHTGLKTRTRI